MASLETSEESFEGCGIFAEIAGSHSRDMPMVILARISCFSTAQGVHTGKIGDMRLRNERQKDVQASPCNR